MRFACVLASCLVWLAAPMAHAQTDVDAALGLGLRAGPDGVSGGVARLDLAAPLASGFGLHGQLEIATGPDDAPPDALIAGGVFVEGENWMAFADLGYGTQSDAAMARTGIDLLAQAGPDLTLGAGPRLTLEGDDGSGQAATQGGLVTAGLRLSARYEVGADWALGGSLQLDRDVTSRSPRSEDEDGLARMSATIMATHRFQLEF